MNLKKLNPTVKFLVILVWGIILTFTNSYQLNLILSGVFVVLLLISGVSIRHILKIYIPVCVAAGGVFMTAMLFSQQSSDVVTQSHAIVNYDYALMIATRVLLFANLGMLFSCTTDNLEFVYSLRDQLKLPNVFVYGILATFNLLPLIKDEAKKNYASFQARGQKTWRFSSKVLTPLFIKTILYSDQITLAMRSKGFDEEGQRSEYTKIEVASKDWIWAVSFSIFLIIATFYISKR